MKNQPPDDQDPLVLPTHLADRRENLFGGRGAVHVWDLLRGGEAQPFSAVLFCQLAPGGSVGKHQQQRDPEIVLCMDGEGTILVDGKARPFTPLTVAHVPFGSSMELRNGSRDAPLLYLIIKAQVDGGR